jgi:hypothetical protein
MAIRDTSVCYFDSTQSGAPALSGTAGTLIAVLDACLVSGFGAVTASSLVVASGIATLTVSAGHGFTDPGAAYGIELGTVVVVSGVTGTDTTLNATWRATVPSATVLTWDCGEIADGTAAGTISVKRAPAGWEKAFSGTNLAAYKSLAIEATGCYLRIDDTPAQFPTVIMYESMTAISTGTGPAPATGTLYFAKSTAANSTTRAWRLLTDGRAFYLFVKADGSSWLSALFFGDIVSYRAIDPFGCVLIAHVAANTAQVLHNLDGNTSGAWLSRSYTQSGGAVAAARYSHRRCQYVGAGGMATPNAVDNSLCLWQIELWEGINWARGILPGMYCPVHNAMLPDGIMIQPEANIIFIIQQIASVAYQAAMNINGPWR